MIDTFFEKIQLDRPIVLGLIIIICAILLTMANNYFFYESKDYNEKSRINNLSNTIYTISSVCMRNTQNKSKCIEEVRTFISEQKSYYGSKIIIKDKNQNILLQEDSRRYKDNERQPIKSDLITIPSLAATIEVITNPIPNLLHSTLNSITLSALDIINIIRNPAQDDDIWDFIKYIAFPRSAPFLSFLIIVGLFFYLFKKYIILRINLVRRLEEEEDEDD